MGLEGVAAAPEDEALWIRRIAGGDRGAFEDLYRAYRRKLFGYLLRQVGDPGLAEELAADVLVEVWKGASGFRGDSRPSTWILGIARHKALDARRRRPPQTVDVEKADQVPDRSEGPDAEVAHNRRRATLRRALTSLPPEQREVIDLTFFEGFSYPEIARLVSCPIGTVKTRMFYARKKLEALLGSMGLEAEIT
jgi:RNA polymerase sigma-70 factor (ECF subfamily)